MLVAEDRESPRLGVVPARCPAGEVENLLKWTDIVMAVVAQVRLRVSARPRRLIGLPVPARPPGALEAIVVGIEVNAPGYGIDFAPPEQDLQCLAAGDTGAEQRTHRRGGPLVPGQIDRGRVD